MSSGTLASDGAHHAGARDLENVQHEADSIWQLIGRIGLLLATFVVADRALTAWTRLPEASWFEPSISLELCIGRGRIVSLVGGFIFIGALFLRPFRRSWSQLSEGVWLRIGTAVLVIVLTWSTALLPRNAYFAEWHSVDRGLLAITALLALWRPVFLLPFVALVYLFLGQKALPIGTYIGAIDLLPLRVTLLLALYSVLSFDGRLCRPGDVLLLAGALAASHYWWPGCRKVALEWWRHEELHTIVFGAWAHGWRGHLAPERVVEVARSVQPFDGALVVGTLILELGAIACFLRRSVLCSFFAACVLFHVGICWLIGYGIWKWALVDLLLLAAFASPMGGRAWLAGGARFLAAAVLIAACPWWAHPPPLAWYDTPFAVPYRVEVETAAGWVRPVHASSFGPYADEFAMAQFAFLSPRADLVGSYGVTHRADVVDGLRDVRSVEELRALEARLGKKSAYDPERVRRFAEFLERWFADWNRQGIRARALQSIAAPGFLMTHRAEDALRRHEPVVAARVLRIETWYDGRVLREISRSTVLEVAIPGAVPDLVD